MAIIGGALAAAAAIAAAKMTNDANRRNARSANDLSYETLYRNQAEQRRQRELATAGTVDASGNRAEYIDGVGWVIRPTETARGIQLASDAETRNRLTLDATRQRLRNSLTWRRQLEDGARADAEMASSRVGERGLDSVRAALEASGVARAVSGADDLRKRIQLQGLRTGTGGEAAIARLGRGAMADTRTALADARLNAPGAYSQARDSRLSGPMQRAALLAGRAESPAADPAITAADPFAALTAGMQRQQMVAPQVTGRALQAPTLAFPQDTTAQQLGGLSSLIMQLGQNKTVRSWFDNTPVATTPAPVETYRGYNVTDRNW